MGFLDRLDALLKERGLNKHTLSQQCGVPYSTINSFYTKGYDNAKLKTLSKIATFLNVPLGYLAWGEVDLGLMELETGLLPDEVELLARYKQLNDEGKEYMRNTVDMVAQYEKYNK